MMFVYILNIAIAQTRKNSSCRSKLGTKSLSVMFDIEYGHFDKIDVIEVLVNAMHLVDSPTVEI